MSKAFLEYLKPFLCDFKPLKRPFIKKKHQERPAFYQKKGFTLWP